MPLAYTPEVARAVENAQKPFNFVRSCKIQTENSEPGYLEPTPTQMLQLEAMAAYKWSLTIKYRQAKITTVAVMDLLRHTMFHPMSRGVVIAEKESTGEEAFSRLALAYKNLDDIIRVPVVRDPNRSEMRFSHDGFINIITGGSRSPAIGHSPDYAFVTEYGEFGDYDTFNGHFFPSVNKRMNGIVRIETTPGDKGSAAHQMWLDALGGEGWFSAPRGCPLFLSWWHDDTCVAYVPPGFVRTPEEVEYAARLLEFEVGALTRGEVWYRYKAPRPIDDAHIMFRRNELKTTFHGDTRLFNAKYPSDPWSCWITGGVPHIPQDAVDRLRNSPRKRVTKMGETAFFEDPEPGCPYLLTCDPAGFGQTGDPSAWILWNCWDRREAAVFSGRVDPGRLADQILGVQRRYDCDVLVETNNPALAEALRSRHCPRLVWEDGQPGWYSTEQSKGAATTALVDMLRNREIEVLDTLTLDQLDQWDGTSRRTKKGHHFDLAISCIIAAHRFQKASYGYRPLVREDAPRPAGVTWRDLDALFPEEVKKRRVY